jgi:hypothetical protein
VVEQRPAPELDNHVGVRHAGALFAVGHAASRALVAAALGQRAESTEVQLLDSEVIYEKAALGSVTATAEPAADDWDSLLSRISEGQVAQLPTAVTVRNEDGKTVTSITICWQASPGGESGPR